MAETVQLTRPAMRRVLFTAASLVFVALVQLFVLTEHTDKFFAWTIAPPKNLYLTAAFLGASYTASFFLEFLAAREHVWARARVAVAPVFWFTVLSLVATLIHRGLFHLGPPLSATSVPPVTRFFGWFWLIIYSVVPIWMGVQWLAQRREPGGDPPREAPLPRWLQLALGAQGTVMALLGVALFVWPSVAPMAWPWLLTPLTARAIGAWLIGFALAAYGGLKENDFARSRPAVAAYAALGVFQLVAVARYAGDLDWASAGVWAYIAFLVSVAAVGGGSAVAVILV